MTKIEIFEAAIRLISATTIEDRGEDAQYCDEVLAGLQHEIDLLIDKRARAKSRSSGVSKKKKEEQDAVIDAMTDVLIDGQRRTATEIGQAVGVSVQKASALLKKMVEAGDCEKVIEKKVSYFFIPTTAEEPVNAPEAKAKEE